MVHAEIEAFLEDRATELATRAFDSWRRDLKPRHTIIALVAFCRNTEKNYSTLAECVGASFATFTNIIQRNHGIKEENVLKFLLPVGIEKTKLDPTWLSTLNSFGTARGQVAHTSVRVHQAIDPRTEFDTVMNMILPGVRDLDDLMTAIK